MGQITSASSLIKKDIEKRAFPARPSSYDENHPNLFFLGKKPNAIACMRYTPALNESKKVILYAHGNGSDIGRTNDFLTTLCTDLQVDIITFDYCKYGLSDGTETTEKNCITSIWNVYEYLLSQGFQRDQIILYGNSIGTGVCVQLAATLSQRDPKNTLHACLLQAPYTSVVGVVSTPLETFIEVAHETFLMPQKNPNILCSLRGIDKIECPVYLLHGTKDSIIAYDHSVRLHDKMQKARKTCYLIPVEKADHNNIESQYYSSILETLQKIVNQIN